MHACILDKVMRILKLPKYMDLWPRVGPNSQWIPSNKWYQPYLTKPKWRMMKAQRHYQESWLLMKAQTNLKAYAKYVLFTFLFVSLSFWPKLIWRPMSISIFFLFRYTICIDFVFNRRSFWHLIKFCENFSLGSSLNQP